MSSLPEYWTITDEWKKVIVEEYNPKKAFFDDTIEYENYKDIPINERGFICIGCEPGSGPAPFIVVYNDGKQLGFVHPYVTVLERTTDGTKHSVYLKLRGDRFGNLADMKKDATRYIIEYASYSAVKTCEKHYFCHCFGSFGNIALPSDSAAEIELQWWEEDIRDGQKDLQNDEEEEKSEKK